MIKKLLKSDLKECLKFIELKSRNSGTTPISKDKFKKNYSQYFSDQENRHAFGYFDNDELKSFMCIGFFENQLRGKFWVVTAYYSKIFRNYFSWNYPETGMLLKHVIEYAESQKYYEWYYSVSKRIANTFERQWKKNSYVPIGRYDLIILDTIEANTIPDNQLYWSLMGMRPKPDPIIIKKRVLKNEFKNISTDK